MKMKRKNRTMIIEEYLNLKREGIERVEKEKRKKRVR
jgi:hypothetical protein